MFTAVLYRTFTRLDAEKHRPDLEGGGPLVLEDVEADTAQLVDVWVVDFCQEANLCVKCASVVRKRTCVLSVRVLSGSNPVRKVCVCCAFCCAA